MQNAFRARRRAVPMTQAHLAEAAGVDVRTIRNLENGKAVSAETELAVRSVLGMSVDDRPAPRPEEIVRDHARASGLLVGASLLVQRALAGLGMAGLAASLYDPVLLSVPFLCLLPAAFIGLFRSAPTPDRLLVAIAFFLGSLSILAILPLGISHTVTDRAFTIDVLVPTFATLIGIVSLVSLWSMVFTLLFDRDPGGKEQGYRRIVRFIRSDDFRRGVGTSIAFLAGRKLVLPDGAGQSTGRPSTSR